MAQRLEKKFGLATAVCMVVGIVIGSGVFFKAQDILHDTGGDMPLGILAWAIGGVVMLICAVNFSTLATRYEKVNGIVDYAEAMLGEKYAYYVGWFMAVLYYPAMTSVLAWVSARYTLALFGNGEMAGGLCMALAALYLCGSYVLNALGPRAAGRFQVVTTLVKLLPLLLMALAGTLAGLRTGNTASAFHTGRTGGGAAPLFAATVAAAFAYEGWIIATSINTELHNAKRNLPIALVAGCLVIAFVYIAYYIGLAGAAPVAALMEHGSQAAFTDLFGRVGGGVLNAFVVVSCLGTLNGLMFAVTRGLYAVAIRGHGPKPAVFSEISPTTNMPVNASVAALGLCALWMFYFYGANLTAPIFGLFSFDSSELPIITIYGFYLPIFWRMLRQHSALGPWRGLILPILGLCSAAFMVFSALYAHGVAPCREAAAQGRFSFPVGFYLLVFAAVMALGRVFYRPHVTEEAAP